MLAVVGVVLVIVALIGGALIAKGHRGEGEIRKAQECVDSGGYPWRPSRMADQTCLYRIVP